MWFEQLTGFPETSPQEVRAKLKVDGITMTSLVTRESFVCGSLEIPSLAELRSKASHLPKAGASSLSEVVGDVQRLHQHPENAGALFQVASQFNLLEMVGPEVTPERGVDIYERDLTQGPACAVAAGAGTIYRNYFVEVDGQVGQRADHQIDCLRDLGIALGNPSGEHWTMKNGYALLSSKGLASIDARLRAASSSERDRLRDLLRIGLHANVEVTLGRIGHCVCQAFCSALPVAYTRHPAAQWETFAQLVLEGAYEATVYAAALNRAETSNPRLFLTLLGGGMFGNELEWILPAIQRAAELADGFGLEIHLVSYGRSNPLVRTLIETHRQHQR